MPAQSESSQHEMRADGAMPPAQTAAWFDALVRQVADVHDLGRLHGGIRWERIRAGRGGLPQLEAPSGGTVSLAEAAALPEEVKATGLRELPANFVAARTGLRQLAVVLSPDQIDLTALGDVLCRTLTGQGSEAYLQSPRTKGGVPEEWRTVIARLLGCDGSERFASVAEVRSALRAVGPIAPDDPAAPRSESDTASSIVGPRRTDDTSVTGSPAAAHDAPSRPMPATLGHYQIVDRIGQGGMGDVYKAYEPQLDRHVAIKVLPEELARHDEFIRRFRTEAMAAARLGHPGIVQVYFVGEDQGRHFFAMELIEGESLSELLDRKGRLSPEESISIIEHCLQALSAAHQLGLIHRDIKPGNILIDRRHRRVLLSDFGLVKALGSTSEGRTTTGVVMGTADYISPEQGRGQTVDARSDLYSVGVMLYRMLSGRLPFAADSATAMIFQHVYEPPSSLGSVAPGIAERLVRVVHRLLAKSPDERFQTAADVLAALRGEAVPSRVPGEGVGRSEGASPRTAIVFPPAPDSPNLPAESAVYPAEEPAGWLDRLLQGAGRAARKVAPELIEQLQTTGQQVDDAIRLHSDRLRDLERLTKDAEGVLADLRRQADASRQDAPQSARQLEELAQEQETQLHEIHLRRDKARAALQMLRSQRDALQARLKAAQAQLVVAGGRAPVTGWRRFLTPRVLAGTAAVAVAVLVVALISSGGRNVGTARITILDPELTARFSTTSVPANANLFQVDVVPGGHWLDVSFEKRLVHQRGIHIAKGDVVSIRISRDDDKLTVLVDNSREIVNLPPVPTNPKRPEVVAGNTGSRPDPESKITTPDVPEGPLEGKGVFSLGSGDEPFPGVIPGPAELKGVRRWQYVPSRTQSFPFEVTDVAWNPKRPLVAVAYRIGEVRLLDTQTRRLKAVWIAHRSPRPNGTGVTGISWSPDGEKLVTVGGDGAILLWDRRGWIIKRCLAGGPMVYCAAWRPDGALFVTGGTDGALRTWNPDGSGGESLAKQEGAVLHCAWSPNGKLIASTGLNQTLRIWKADGSVNAEVATTRTPRGVAWLQGGLVALLDDAARLTLYQADGTRFQETAAAPMADYLRGASDGSKIATAGRFVGGTEIRLVGPDGAEIDKVPQGANAFAFSPDGNSLAFGTNFGKVGLCDLVTKEIAALQEQGGMRSTITAWSDDGTKLATNCPNGSIRLWDEKGAPIVSIPRSAQRTTLMQWDRAGTRIAAIGSGGTLDMVDVEKRSTNSTAAPSLQQIQSVAWSPDASRLALAGYDFTTQTTPVRLFAPGNFGAAIDLPAKGRSRGIAWSADGKSVVVASSDPMGTATLWNLEDPAKLMEVRPVLAYQQGQIMHRVVPHPTNPARFLLTGQSHARRPNIIVLDTDGTTPVQIASHLTSEQQGSCMAMSASWNSTGDKFVTGGDDSVVRTWSADGAPLLELKGHVAAIDSVSWRGDRISSSSVNGSAVVWNAADGRPQWALIAVDDSDQLLQFDNEGKLMSGSDQKANEALVAVVEHDDGRQETLSLGEFRKRFGR